MTKNNDAQWLDGLAENYIWPEPSHQLEHKILMQAKPPTKESRKNYIAAILDAFTFNWQPALALASALVLGICLGNFTLSQDIQSTETGIYANSDYAFAQSILAKYQKEGAYHE